MPPIRLGESMAGIGRCIGVGTTLAVIALGLAGLPSDAADFDYTASPASGPAGTAITLTSTTPCPPGAGGVDVELVDATGNRVAGTASMTNDGPRWSGTLTVAPAARNGSYGVLVHCRQDSSSSYLTPMRRFLVTSPSGGEDPAVRIAAASRIGTAVAVSQDLHPEANAADAVVLSRFDSYADALAGSPLAERLGGPLLLTAPGALDPMTRAELARVLVPSGTVHVLGGKGAIGDAVVADIESMGFTTVRYAGVNRYDTAVKIARTFGQPGAVLLANGGDFRDGLVAGVAAPRAGADGPGVVLLTNGRTMPAETKAYLAQLGKVTTFAVGAPAAAAAPSAVPLVGSDPSDTSRKVAAQFFPAPNAVAVATSASFADALSGGAHAAANDAPLLLAPSASLPASVRQYFQERRATIVIAFVYGGTGVVSDDVRSATAAAIS